MERRVAVAEPTTDALAHAIDGLHAIENGVRLRLLEQIAAYDAREAWREDGACSMTDWLAFRHGYSRQTAADLVRVAQQFPSLQAIRAAFEDGRLSWDKVVLVTSVATAENDELWADEASILSVARLASWVRHHRRRLRTEAERKLKSRYLRAWWNDDEDALHLSGRIPGADGAAVKKAIELIADDAPPGPDGSYEPHDRRCADALVDLAAAHLAVGSDTDRATVVVHVDVADLNKIHGSATLEDGPSVVAETARRLACDGRVQLSVDAANGEPVGLGRTRRTISPWLAREIHRRDGGCRFADCGRTRGLQVHHIHHWAHGGTTDLDNLVLLCRFHHRLIHEGGWRLIKDSSSCLRFVRPDGFPLSNRPRPLRPRVRARMFGPALARAAPG